MAVNKGSIRNFEKPIAVRFCDHRFVQFFSILLKYVDLFFAYSTQMIYEAGKILT